MNSLPWTHVPLAAERKRLSRDAAAAVLRAASALLARLAQAMAVPQDEPTSGPVWLEFHAEAGAPEGALYVNGRLVGHLEGVQRL